MTGNNKVLITGATGFIGSNLAKKLVLDGHEVFATRRVSSSMGKCHDFAQEVNWINVEESEWTNSVHKIKPDILIHSAWQGLREIDRKNWELQMANFEFSKLLIDTAIESGVKKIIALGSQAEYGTSSVPYTESNVPSPIDAYGSVKLLTSSYLNISCREQNIPWYWLRVFSVFGPGEDNEWLIPQVMAKLSTNQEIQLTAGKQAYDYLYIDDLVSGILMVLNNSSDSRGIYNMCSGKTVEIRELLTTLADLLNVQPDLLKFGTIPYREHQNMYIAGDCTRFEAEFGQLATLSMERSLTEMVNQYKKI